MERFSESDCSACGLPVPVDLMPDGNLVRYADAQATVEALQRELDSANALLHKKNCAIGKAEMAINELQALRDERDRLRRVLEDIRDSIGCGALNVNWIKQYAEAALNASGPAADGTEDKAMKFPTLRTYSFSLPEGVVRLELPHPLSAASADELIQWLSIIERQVKRSPSPPARRRNELLCQPSNDSVVDTTLKG